MAQRCGANDKTAEDTVIFASPYRLLESFQSSVHNVIVSWHSAQRYSAALADGTNSVGQWSSVELNGDKGAPMSQ